LTHINNELWNGSIMVDRSVMAVSIVYLNRLLMF
jgi:hypothetical protein